MTPQAQTGIGNDHAWAQGRRRTGATRIVVGANQDPEREQGKLLAVGGEVRAQERRAPGVRVWSDEHQRHLTVQSEVLTWFARHLAEADAAREDRGGGTGTDARDPQYLLSKAEGDFAMFELALKAAKAAILKEQAGG